MSAHDLIRLTSHMRNLQASAGIKPAAHRSFRVLEVHHSEAVGAVSGGSNFGVVTSSCSSSGTGRDVDDVAE